MSEDGLYRTILSALEVDVDPASRTARSSALPEAIHRLCNKLTITHGPVVARNVAGVFLTASLTQTQDQIVSHVRRRIARCTDYDVLTTQREEEEGFDYQNHTETTQIYEQLELPEPVSIERATHYARYTPSPIRSVRLILDRIQAKGVKYHEFAFLDIGSGLGRNLLIALDYPFKRIIGVEVSKFLHSKSLRNIEQYQANHPNKIRVEAYCADVLEYDLPNENVLLYFFQPFDAYAAERFVHAMETHVAAGKKQIMAVYLAGAPDVIKRSGRFRLCDMFETCDRTVSQYTGCFVVSVFESVGG